MSRSGDNRCDDCGRFMPFKPTAGSWANIYSFDPGNPGLNYTHWRCWSCTEALGPAESNARPYNGDMTSYEGSFSPPPEPLEPEQ